MEFGSRAVYNLYIKRIRKEIQDNATFSSYIDWVRNLGALDTGKAFVGRITPLEKEVMQMIEVLIIGGIVLLISSMKDNGAEKSDTTEGYCPPHKKAEDEIRRREIRETHTSMFTKGGTPLF